MVGTFNILLAHTQDNFPLQLANLAQKKLELTTIMKQTSESSAAEIKSLQTEKGEHRPSVWFSSSSCLAGVLANEWVLPDAILFPVHLAGEVIELRRHVDGLRNSQPPPSHGNEPFYPPRFLELRRLFLQQSSHFDAPIGPLAEQAPVDEELERRLLFEAENLRVG